MGDDGWREFLARFEDDAPPEQAKYITLRDAIAAAIERGYWKPGDRLPTELALSELTAYSLGTVQRAMRALADTGVVVRRQGHGTFVSMDPDEVNDPWHYRFLDDSGFGFLSVHILSTVMSRIGEPGRWTRVLSPPLPEILRVQRLVNVGGEFTVMSRLYLRPADVEETMAKLHYVFDWATVRKALAGRTRMPVTHVSESVTMARLPGDVVRLLGVAERTTGMYIESIARAGHDEYLYFQQIYVPPTRRRLHIATHTHREPERRTEIAPAPSPQEPPT